MSKPSRGRRPRDVSPEVEAVRQRIQEWRATREKRTHMPESLWEAAADVARKHGLWFVSRVLRVRYEGLKKRTQPSTATAERSTVGGFVEVDLAQFGGGAKGGATVIELSDEDGAKLVVRLEGRDVPAVLALATSFWGRGR